MVPWSVMLTHLILFHTLCTDGIILISLTSNFCTVDIPHPQQINLTIKKAQKGSKLGYSHRDTFASYYAECSIGVTKEKKEKKEKEKKNISHKKYQNAFQKQTSHRKVSHIFAFFFVFVIGHTNTLDILKISPLLTFVVNITRYFFQYSNVCLHCSVAEVTPNVFPDANFFRLYRVVRCSSWARRWRWQKQWRITRLQGLLFQ